MIPYYITYILHHTMITTYNKKIKSGRVREGGGYDDMMMMVLGIIYINK